MILSLRDCAADQSSFGSPQVMPNSFEFWISDQTSAFCKSALVGMQPTCRHVPPSFSSFSTTATLSPNSAARNAATYPPGPLPTMITSKEVVGMEEVILPREAWHRTTARSRGILARRPGDL